MKNIQLLILCISLGVMNSSCNLLEEDPPSLLSPVTIFNSVDNLELGVNGIYDVLGQPFVDGNLRWGNYHRALVVLGTLGTDVGQSRGGNSTNVQGTLNYFTYNPSSQIPSEVYRVHYVAINRANTMISEIQRFRNETTLDEFDAARLNRLEAEAKFLRAFYYFNLVRYYGDVPLKLTPTASLTAPDVLEIARSPVLDVYLQIEEDLLFAEENLLLPSEMSTGMYGRASKTAAWGLLARVYNTWAAYPLKDNSKWSLAATYCEQIINSAEHSLLPSYDAVFATRGEGNEINDEVMFSVRFSQATGEEGAFVTQVGNFGGGAYTSGFVASEAAIMLERSFYESYDTINGVHDIRFRTTVGNYRANGPGGADTVAFGNDRLKNLFTAMIKWVRDGSFSGYNSPHDYPLIRYADVLLMYAEATAQANGSPTEASYDAINQVRRRAFNGDDAADLAGLTAQEFIDAVLQERKWELCAEDGSRWHDLIRYEQLTVETISKKYRWDTGAGIQNFFDPETHKLFPIPQLEINTNPLMTQNPGY